MNRLRLVPLASAMLVVVGCAAGTPVPSVGPPTPGPSVTSGPDIFEGMPYVMTLPADWIGGSAANFNEGLQALESANPELAAKVRSLSPTVENEVVAFAQDGSLAVSINTLPIGGMADSVALDESERQNVQGIASLPSTTKVPKSTRVQLPIGEAVRITWSSSVVDPATGAPQLSDSIGYAMVKRHTLFVAVFTFDSASDQLGAIGSIMETFAVRG